MQKACTNLLYPVPVSLVGNVRFWLPWEDDDSMDEVVNHRKETEIVDCSLASFSTRSPSEHLAGWWTAQSSQ